MKPYYECDYCKNRFTSKWSTKLHVLAHMENGGHFQCPICGKRYVKSAGLEKHMRRNHSLVKPSFVCEICSASFPRKTSLKWHKRRHAEQRDHKCKICLDGFTSAGDLKLHLRVHDGEKPFQCNICKREFKTRQGVQVHLRTHPDHDELKCPECSAKFTSNSSLKAHLQRHLEFNPKWDRSCIVCKACFTDKKSLNAHMVTHREKRGPGRPPKLPQNPHDSIETPRNFVCDFCPKSFTRKYYLETHVTNKHFTDPVVYVCYICDKIFTCESKLRRHMYAHDTHKSFECVICNKRMKTEDSLKLHIQRHGVEVPQSSSSSTSSTTRVTRSCTASFLKTQNEKRQRERREREMARNHSSRASSEEIEENFNASTILEDQSQNQPVNSENEIKCTICKRNFEKTNKMNAYMLENNKQTFLCDICSTDFSGSQYVLQCL